MRTAIIYNFLIEANIMAGLAILLMLIVRKFFRRYLGSRVICLAWLLVAIRLLCPLSLPNPLIQEIRSPFAPDEAIRPIAGQVQVRISDALSDLYMQSYRLTGPAHESAVTQAIKTLDSNFSRGIMAKDLMKVYCAGGLGIIGWFIFANVRFRHRLKADRIEALSGDLLDEYLALCKEMDVKPLPVYYVDPLPSACLVGVIRPYIALPLTASPQETLPILKHEICHFKGRDHIVALVRLICCIVHWFNPLVWLAADMSRTDGELACDERVTRNMDGGQKKEYAGILVFAAAKKNAPGLPVLATGMTMTGKKLKNRIKSILEGKPVKAFSITFAVLSCLLLICAFATAENLPVSSHPLIPSKPVLSFETLTDEESVIAKAREILALEGINRDSDKAQWTVEESPLKIARYLVTMHVSQDESIMLHLEQNGELVALDIPNRSVYDGEEKRYLESELWRISLKHYAMGFVWAVNPDAFDAADPVYDRGDRVVGRQRYAIFEIFPSNSPWDTSITVVLELTDRVRVAAIQPGNG